jgi:hypothetical protein
MRSPQRERERELGGGSSLLWNQLSNFHKVWYRHYDIGDHLNTILFLISYKNNRNMADEKIYEV